jgi:hypothetical protein
VTTVRQSRGEHPVPPLDADHPHIGQYPDPHAIERFGEDARHLDSYATSEHGLAVPQHRGEADRRNV